jgi:hypothetical protein
VIMRRSGFLMVGLVCGVAWASGLRAFMMALAGPASTFTFGGTFGIIISTGAAVGALLGLAEYQRRIGHRYRILIATPLLLGLVPLVLGDGGGAQFGLAGFALITGYAVSGRGPLWTRILAWVVTVGAPAVPFLAPKPADLSPSTAYGAWFGTLSASLGLVLGLACAIPMMRNSPHAEPAEGLRIPSRSEAAR